MIVILNVAVYTNGSPCVFITLMIFNRQWQPLTSQEPLKPRCVFYCLYDGLLSMLGVSGVGGGAINNCLKIQYLVRKREALGVLSILFMLNNS